MRKLVSIRTVSDVQPIEGADLIEVYTIDGWKVVDRKNAHRIGDKVVYFEIDSFLPERPEFEFLRKSSYRELNGQKGFRLRTAKLRGQVSQGLILSVNQFPELADCELGDDVSDKLGVIKYEPPIPAELAGQIKGAFPSFLVKTDEERIQNLVSEYDQLRTLEYYVTEKLDGSSATFYYKDGDFGVCSRNWELKETESNTFWRVARTLDLETKLAKVGNICLQGELIGVGIQGNPYKLSGHEVKFFNAFDINKQQRLSYEEFTSIVESLDLASVPVLVNDRSSLPALDDLLLEADGVSQLNSTAKREGLVFRTLDSKVSFKVISNKFLLKASD